MIFRPRKAASLSVAVPDLGLKIKAWQRLMPEAFDRGLEAGMRAATIDISARVKRLLSGEVLNRRTHRLWRSIQPEVFHRRGRIVGIVGTDVKYAAIHEFGGTIRPRKAGGLLFFPVNGELAVAREVTMPRRPFMSRAFEERADRATNLIRDAIMKSVKGTLESRTKVAPGARKGVGHNAD